MSASEYERLYQFSRRRQGLWVRCPQGWFVQVTGKYDGGQESGHMPCPLLYAHQRVSACVGGCRGVGGLAQSTEKSLFYYTIDEVPLPAPSQRDSGSVRLTFRTTAMSKTYSLFTESCTLPIPNIYVFSSEVLIFRALDFNPCWLTLFKYKSFKALVIGSQLQTPKCLHQSHFIP